MKVLLVIAIFYINYVTSREKYAVKSYPKKVKPFGAGKILINSPKYMFKPHSPEGAAIKLYKYKKSVDESINGPRYTVFQVIGNSKAIRGVPDSPYFSVDQVIEQKPRVKKVLPDYVWSSLGRIKRSVPEEITTVTTESKNETIKESTTIKPAEKQAVQEKTERPEENQTIVKRAQDDSTPKDSKKNDVTTVKNEELRNQTTAVSKVTNNIIPIKKNAPSLRKGKKNKAQRKRKDSGVKRSGKSKTRNGTRSKNKLREKSKVANGTALDVKSGKRLRSKSKSKQKKSKKSHSLRHPKSSKKSKKALKKNPRVDTAGNSTDINMLKETRRLTGAREALIEDYPYTVSIQKDGVHWCSGALLNPRIVITTANCLWKADRISRMEVRCGSSSADQGGQLANIQEVKKHPKWSLRHTPDNDVALLLLDRNIKFSHSVHAVDLPNRVMLPAFDDAWITSFGSERRDGIFEEHETTLQVYHSNLMSNESCNNITTRFGVAVTENFICFSQTGKTSPCTRDTGAPAVSDGVLWGLASWSIRKLCGTERFPSVFSYTASHSNMDFITLATRQMMSDKRLYQFLDRTFHPNLLRHATTRPPRV
ncbi:unnamed protein product [Arctia plantaginis]|uniref:Peptidase S1 domain-containing protein n=1 Tax=Arctia plantaginis TaxID=874455 RepID=A0A8S0ZB88_ARCPL|nr:unnamed protein product [Arctia plantaginis]